MEASPNTEEQLKSSVFMGDISYIFRQNLQT